MNDRKQSNVAATGRLLLLLVLACFMMPQAARGQVRRPDSGAQAEKKACTADDKVAVTAFSLDPSQPNQGQSVTATMTIRNKCPEGTAVLSVPWKIYVDSQMIQTGTTKISAGNTADVTASWRAVAGSHHFSGSAYNNTVPDVIINVPQRSADTMGVSNEQPQLETQTLDYQKAKQAGAGFAHSPDGPTGTCDYGQMDLAEAYKSHSVFGPGPGVVFFVVCTNPPPTGARANPEAFTNFTLRNGWKIKDVLTEQKEKHSGDWQWVTRPRKGDNNPYMKMHVWSYPSGWLYVIVKVIIEGPAGTDPYQ